MTQERLIRLAAMTVALGLPATPAVAQMATQQRVVRPPVAKISDYSWIDRADALWEAIGDAPPDYAFAFEGVEPWAWETADGHQIVVEDAGQGGIRSYYFAPGERSPFLVVEPGASFGFVGDTVAMVYGPDGGAVPRSLWGVRPERGRVLFARARLIQRAMMDRRGVDPDAWNVTSGLILSFIEQWDIGRQRHPGWRAHRGSAESAGRRHRLERERDKRRGEAGVFERWRRGSFQGPPPPGFEPHRRGPRSNRPHPPGAGPTPARPPVAAPGQRIPRWKRERAPGDPERMELPVPGTPARGGPVAGRPSRPSRPVLEDRVPVQPAPAPLPPAPVERVEPVYRAPDAGRPDRPDRGARPPRVQPAEPTPQPVEIRPEPAPQPQIRPFEPAPAPERPAAVQPERETPAARPRPAKLEWSRPSPLVERDPEPAPPPPPPPPPSPSATPNPPAEITPDTSSETPG